MSNRKPRHITDRIAGAIAGVCGFSVLMLLCVGVKREIIPLSIGGTLIFWQTAVMACWVGLQIKD